jgi:hypothetical protein
MSPGSDIVDGLSPHAIEVQVTNQAAGLPTQQTGFAPHREAARF